MLLLINKLKNDLIGIANPSMPHVLTVSAPFVMHRALDGTPITYQKQYYDSLELDFNPVRLHVVQFGGVAQAIANPCDPAPLRRFALRAFQPAYNAHNYIWIVDQDLFTDKTWKGYLVGDGITTTQLGRHSHSATLSFKGEIV